MTTYLAARAAAPMTAIVLLAGTTLLPASPAAGQQQDPARGVPVVSLRETAAVLARSGAANDDPRSVLAAARILITAQRPATGLRRLDAPPSDADTLRPAEERKAGQLTASGLLRLASRIAVEQGDAPTARTAARLAGDAEVGLGDEELARELGRAAEAVDRTRGAAGGPIWEDGYISTGEVAEFEIGFEGGFAPNRIRVSSSDARGDLDCYLYEAENLVARDAGYEGDCSIEWSQKLEGEVRLRVRNTGAGTYFVLVSN